MGFLSRLSTVAPQRRVRALSGDPFDDRYYPGSWHSRLSAAGIEVTPDLALTLSAYYCGVTTIGYDLATLPCQVFVHRQDGGKDRIQPKKNAVLNIGDLAYKLRWQPNEVQTASEFFLNMVAQFLLRGVAFAEIVAGRGGFVQQLLPRHPDRITQERLPSGRVRYKLIEANGQPRYLVQEEMFVVRDLALNGLNSPSRVQYGAQAIGGAVAAEQAAGKFFKSGMTASVVATYTGDMEDEEEADLHKSITRYAAGVENSFGLLLIPDNVSVKNLAVEPEKAQMMLAREWGAREVARQLRIPGHKLGIAGTQTYASQVQSSIDYVISCLRPIAVTFEQAIQRDLILYQDYYFTEFLLEALLRGDPDARASYYERAIRNRWMRPSEVRLRENMNPDPELDELSKGDFRPGASQTPTAPPAGATANKITDIERNEKGQMTRLIESDLPPIAPTLKSTLALHDNAKRCLRRERAAIEKLAKKHANDPDGWKRGLRSFYSDHANFVAETMRLPPAIAAAYAAQHGTLFAEHGAGLMVGHGMEREYAAYEQAEADQLTALALDPRMSSLARHNGDGGQHA